MPFLLKHFPQIRNEQSRQSAGAFVNHVLLSCDKIWKHELIFGSAMCAIIALLGCPLVRGKPFEPQVPILFLVVVTGIARRFGSGAGTLGTVVSASIFAELLFEPIHRLAVNNPVEKINLAWMIIGGLAISNFFGRSKKPRRIEDTDRDHDQIVNSGC